MANDEDDKQAETGLDKNHDVYFVPGLQRGLRVLEAVAHARRPLSVSEVAKVLGVTRSSAFRLIYTLRHMGFLEAVRGSKNFTLGGRVLSLGFAYLASMNIIDIARPELEALRDTTGVTAHLSVRDDRELLYLACVQSRSGFLSTINVGARFPAHAMPMGWLLMADLSPRTVAALFPEKKYEALTEHTPTNLESLLQRVSLAGAQGYVISRAIIEPGGSSIAAPIFDSQDQVVGAIDISGPDSAFDIPNLDSRYLNEVLATAKRISARLGHTPSISSTPIEAATSL